MASLLVHAALGVTVVWLIVVSNRAIFRRTATGPVVSTVELALYVVGVASVVLGWYFNIRFVRDYSHGHTNPIWGDGSWAQYIKLMFANPASSCRPGLHIRQCDHLAADHDRRWPTPGHRTPVAVLRLQPVHELRLRLGLLPGHRRTAATARRLTSAMDDLDGLGDKELIQSALRGDFELIGRYGEEHPGTWAERGSTTSRPCVSSPRSPAMSPGTRPRCAPGSGIPAGSSWRGGSIRSPVSGGYERRSSAPSGNEPQRPAVRSSSPSERERESSAWPCERTRRTWQVNSPPATGALSGCGWDSSVSQAPGAAIRGRPPGRAGGAGLRGARDERRGRPGSP